MQAYFDTVTDRFGNSLPGASVYVTTFPGGTPATLFSAPNGVTPLPNPLTTDVNGTFQFAAPNGDYGITVTAQSTGSLPTRYITLFDSSGLSGNFLSSLTNIVALRNLAVITALLAPVYQIEGYFAPGDGGGGAFVYVSSDTTSADNGGTIIVDILGRRWYRDRTGSDIYANWFGLVPGSNNYAALNNAATVAGVGGKVVIPGVTQSLKLTTSITFNCDVEHQSSAVPHLQPANGVSINYNGRVSGAICQWWDFSMGGTIGGTPIINEAFSEWAGANHAPIGQADSAFALNTITTWLTNANTQGSTTSGGSIGYGRATLRLLPTVYLIDSATWNQQPFINYIGCRATTINGTLPINNLSASRGTIIRASANLYGNTSGNPTSSTPCPQGTVVNVPTGDWYGERWQVVGTAQISGNASIGTNWAANTSGVSAKDITVYACTQAHLFNGIADAHFEKMRIESCTLGWNFAAGSSNELWITDSVSFAVSQHIVEGNGSTNSVQFSQTNFITAATGEVIYRHNDGEYCNSNIVFGSGCVLESTLAAGNCTAIDMRASGANGGTNYKQTIKFVGAVVNNLYLKWANSGSGDSGQSSARLLITGGTNMLNCTIQVFTRHGMCIGGDSVLDNTTIDFTPGAATIACIRNITMANISGTAINTNPMQYALFTGIKFENVGTEFGGVASWASNIGSKVYGNVTDRTGAQLPEMLQNLDTTSPTVSGRVWDNGGVYTIH